MKDPTTTLLNCRSENRNPQQSEIEDEAFRRVAEALKKMAKAALGRIRRYDPTVDTTGVVDEVFVKLSKQSILWESRQHYLAYAQIAMKRIVINAWRRACAPKRGGGLQRVPLNEGIVVESSNSESFPHLDDAMELLSRESPRAHRITRLFYFDAVAQDEIAIQLNVSTATVTRDLRFGEAFLFAKLNDHGSSA